MKNFKIVVLIFFVLFLEFFVVKNIFADSIIDNGLNFLRSKQDLTGRINTGFSAPSQWSAIAFSANDIDISTVKNPAISLQDFLVGNFPSEPSSATDWETRILAIVATGGNPTNYGGINYVTHLEGFYNDSQIGDICSLNDDIFGLLAEVSAGASSSAVIKQNVLDFLISKQDPIDGGFGFSAPGCDWYSTSADMTAAAIQALVEAKQNGLTNPGLDSSIDRAKDYILVNQNADGGYGYYGSSDTDTTGWVLMAFNVLDMKESTPSAKTRGWLTSQQSTVDGGFLAFDYGSSSFVSNATTTAQAIIGLSGKNWIIKIFDPTSVTPTLTTGSGNPTPTQIQPTPTDSTNFPTPTVTQNTPTNNPTATPTSMPEPTIISEVTEYINPSPTTEGQILGIKAAETKQIYQSPNKKIPTLAIVFFGLGVLSLLIYKAII